MLDVPRAAASDPAIPFPTAYPRCLAMLEGAVQECLDHPEDDYCRTRAHGVALAMLEGCKVCGYREDSGILETVADLLRRPLDPAASTVPDLRERFRGLFGFLKSQSRVRSA
jgi:hypothetical protein